MQEVDSERRIQLLRGLPAKPLEASTDQEHDQTGHASIERLGQDRKKRKLPGEDDTDRDIRYAVESQALVPLNNQVKVKRVKSSNAPLTDSNGHINLFPAEALQHKKAKNPEVEAEEARKKRESEDQYTMRFSNAAGFKQNIGESPWYQSGTTLKEEDGEVERRDVWGKKDPQLKERQKMRIAADDPLTAIKRGVQGVRRVEKERREWREEKMREVDDLIRVEKRESRKRRHRDERGRREEYLEGFSLDDPLQDEKLGHHRPHHRHHHHHRHSHKHRHRDSHDAYSRRHSHHDNSPKRDRH